MQVTTVHREQHRHQSIKGHVGHSGSPGATQTPVNHMTRRSQRFTGSNTDTSQSYDTQVTAVHREQHRHQSIIAHAGHSGSPGATLTPVNQRTRRSQRFTGSNTDTSQSKDTQVTAVHREQHRHQSIIGHAGHSGSPGATQTPVNHSTCRSQRFTGSNTDTSQSKDT